MFLSSLPSLPTETWLRTLHHEVMQETKYEEKASHSAGFEPITTRNALYCCATAMAQGHRKHKLWCLPTKNRYELFYTREFRLIILCTTCFSLNFKGKPSYDRLLLKKSLIRFSHINTCYNQHIITQLTVFKHTNSIARWSYKFMLRDIL